MKGFAALVIALCWAPLFGGTLDQYATSDSRLNASPVLQTYSSVAGYDTQAHLWDTKFKAAYGPRWEILIDVRGGRPAHVYGQGIPVLPGIGNSLPYTKETTVEDLSATAFSFVKDNSSLFGVNANELKLDRTAQVDEFWYLSYKRVYQGMEVKGAKLSMTVSHGNLVAFGFLNYGDISTNTKPTLTGAQAQDALFHAVGGQIGGDVIMDPGSLGLYPIMTNGFTSSTYTGALGGGYDHLLAWKITFEREGEGAWTALVDAHTGALVSLTRNAASAEGKVTGGVYKFTEPGMPKSSLLEVGMPYADVRQYENCYGVLGGDFCKNSNTGDDLDDPAILYTTNSKGIYYYEGFTPLETRLVSHYVAIFPNLGPYNETNKKCTCLGWMFNMCIQQESVGVIALHGTDGANSCEYVGSSSDLPYNRPGNSNAARTAFYHGTMVKRQWENYFHLPEYNGTNLPPSCTWTDTLCWWIRSPIPVQVSTPNYDQYEYPTTQNPHGTIRLSKEDRFGNNEDSAEIPSPIYHEIGHGLDTHDVTGSLNGGQDHSEAYADIVAALMTHDSCIARGWLKNTNACYGDGNLDECLACGGYRDIDYTKHASNTRHTVANWLPVCDTATGPQKGFCNKQAHCEGEIATQAFWDLKRNLTLPEYGGYDEATAWFIVDRLFKRAVNTAGPAFFSCDTTTDENGMEYSSLFSGMIMADSNSGDYSLKGPHYAAIEKAFKDHGIYANRTTTPGIACLFTIRPTVTASAANGLIHLTWTASENASRYEVWRNEAGPDMGYTKIAVTYSPEYFDVSLLNGQTYWYRVVPTGSSSTCVGSSSYAARVDLPPTGSLLLLPKDSQLHWLVNMYKTVKLQAYGGSGTYTWRRSAGDLLPDGIALNATTGELYGKPTALTNRTFTIEAKDTADGTLIGTRQYTLSVVNTGEGFDFIPSFIPSARVSRWGDMNPYSVELLPASSGITDYDFSIVDGALPEGLTCGCKWVGQWPSTTYKCSIEGTISCNGESAPCSKRGLYKFTVGMTGKLFGQDRYTERAFELPVFDGAGDAIVAPPEGTTAGGTKVRVYMRQNLTLADAAFKMTLKDAACQAPLSGMAPLPVESQTLLYHDSSTNYIQYELTTPRGLEGCADVVLYAKTLPLRTITNGYQYKTLAYTANQNDESLSVVDATQNQPFTPQTGIHAPAGTVPFGMELALDGRTLWVTDYAAGNLQRYDAANLEYQGTLPLQDPNQPYEGYGATDVAVDSQGTAYVIHQTTGLEAYPEGSPYWNPAYGGISLVDTAAGEVVDWDGDEMTTSDGAPDGISRIPLDLYPLSIAILRLDRDPGQYIEGDGWPGEYAFISGVGPYVPIYPISWRCICKKLMDQPPFEVCEYPCHWCGGSQWPLARRLCWPQRYQPRPVRIAILDLNPWKYALNDQGILARAINPNYRRIIGWGDIGTYGQNPGISSQGLDFSVAYAGTTPTGATVLAASPGEERVYAFDFLSAVREPHTFLLEEHPVYCADADGNYATCYPTDVKVQKGVKGPDSTSKTVALVTNSWNDSISVLNLDNPAQIIPNVMEDNACTARDRYPLSIDTRTDAKHAYVADYQSVTASGRSTLGVVNLDTMAMNAPACEIEVGPAPVRVVVQPVVVASDLSQAIQTDLAYAEPTSFADATKQDILIQEWNTVHLLQETGANPQAVVVNINNFQRSVNRWVTAPALQTDLNQAVDLYRAAYLKEHPAGQ